MRDRLFAFIFTLVRGAVAGVALGIILAALGLSEVTKAPFDVYTWTTAFVGAVIGVCRRERWLYWGIGAAVTMFLLVAFTPMVDSAIRPLVRRDPVSAPVDAIIVLSAGITDAGTLNPHGTDRMLTGLAMHRQFLAADVATTTVTRSTHTGGIISSAPDQRWLLQLFDSTMHAVHVDSVHTTHDEVARLFRLGQTRGWHRVIVVTSPPHTRRACAAFERVGFHVVCVPSRSSLATEGVPMDRIVLARELWYEVIGWWWYRIRGWV